MKSWLARWLMQPWRGRALALGIAALLAIGWVGLLPGSLQLLDERSIGRPLSVWSLRNGALQSLSVTPGELR